MLNIKRKTLVKMLAGYSRVPVETRKIIDTCIKIYLGAKNSDQQKIQAFDTILNGLEPYLTEEEIKQLGIHSLKDTI